MWFYLKFPQLRMKVGYYIFGNFTMGVEQLNR